MMRELVLIAGGFERALADHPRGLRLPTLERLLARGRRESTQAEARPALQNRWQRQLLEGLDPTLDPSQYASAPVSWLGLGCEPYAGTCWHATAVHVAATTDRLQLLPVGLIEPDEEDALADLLGRELTSADYRFEALPGGHWFLRAAADFAAVTTPVEGAFSADMRDTLPAGRDAAMIRRLMTEAQMLLHEHPINAIRAAAGRLPVNGIWCWGGGSFPAPRGPSEAFLCGEDPFLHGLARLHGQSGGAASPALLEDLEARTVMVVQVASLAGFAEEWLAPLPSALRAGRVGCVTLGLESRWVRITARDLRKFWKRSRSVAEVLG